MPNLWNYAAAASLLAGLSACGPIETKNTVIIQQPKPLDINVNLSGKLELVITDARKDLETINGEKPKRDVTPEDVGLPPDAATDGGSSLAPAPDPLIPIALLTAISPPADAGASYFIATEEDLIKSMAARHKDVRALMAAKVVGESHTGLLVAKGPLSDAQTATMKAENADRDALYDRRAADKKITREKAALAYYLERLRYVEKGEWVEKYDKQTKQWNWIQWDK